MGRKALILLLRLSFVVGTAFIIYSGVTDLRKVWGELSRLDPLIVFWPKSALEPPLAVMFLALTMTMFLPAPPPGPTPRSKAARAAEDKRMRPVKIGLGVALVCMPIVILAPFVASFAIGARLEAMGYAPCPSIFEGVRKLRWTRPTPQAPHGSCPTHS